MLADHSGRAEYAYFDFGLHDWHFSHDRLLTRAALLIGLLPFVDRFGPSRVIAASAPAPRSYGRRVSCPGRSGTAGPKHCRKPEYPSYRTRWSFRNHLAIPTGRREYVKPRWLPLYPRRPLSRRYG